MPPFGAVAATVLPAAVLWVGLGAIGSRVSYFGILPSPVAGLLLPATLPTGLWFGAPAAVAATTVLAGAAYAGGLALLLLLVQRREARAVVPAWFAVVVTGFVVTALVQAALVLPQVETLSRSYAAGQVVQALAPAGLWGVVWGWLPALLGARAARSAGAASARPGRAVAPAAVAVVAGAVLLLAVPPLTRTTGETPPPAAAAPSPAPTHIGWAAISPSPSPVAADVCDTGDVTASLGTADAATGHRMLPILVTNTSDRSCVLDGYADVVFDDADGDAMNPLVVTGGSFMTTDRGPKRIRLAPGETAEADLGWNAQSAAGDQRAATVFVSVHPGADRIALPADLDITSSGSIALTAWHRAPTPAG